ncbi:hypothetical protein BA893_06970 [Vibrio natriegens]|uniref:hypothetical protein n=1 Tax=Vibrio natriegens TaxID=691 RepID=UPI000803FD06|nr:hypothetical protein [Vibrio natriegens]ANQ21422.1 hypothetical protein BA893_06970 [Vibrio natriegens]
MRKNSNQDLTLLDCLQLADKRELLAKSKAFRDSFGFTKQGFERFIKDAEKIRNEVAHSQDSIISCLPWDNFVEVLEHVDMFLSNSDEAIEDAGKKGARDFVEYLTTTA